jgi:heme/copper-type cytochrome/quinol oxidase subunit 4
MKRFVPYLHEVLFTIIAVANMALAAWAFAVHGKVDATVLLWIVVCLGLAQMSVLRRKFVEMTKANEKAMDIIQTNVDRVLKHEVFRSHGGAR